MHSILKLTLLLLSSLFLWSACKSDQVDKQESVLAEGEELVLKGTVNTEPEAASGADLCISTQPFNTTLLTDAYGDINAAFASSIYNPKFALQDVLKLHYHRIGCSSDTCKREFTTLAAVQYPKDTLLQNWMRDVLSTYYYDVTRSLDIIVNGEKTEGCNEEGELRVVNRGCRPYSGPLNDDGKEMFDYYQARIWTIGKEREDSIHGPGGRYTSIIYQCWESLEVSSWFVAYSTSDSQWASHYVTSFDRRDGHQLTLPEVIKDDCIAELNDLVAEAARGRQYQLRKNKSVTIITDDGDFDYSAGIQINSIGFTAEGLAVSTSALPFDQWPRATHILIIPYSLVNPLLQGRYRR